MKYPMSFRLLFTALLISFINIEYSGFHAQGDTTWVSTYTWEAQNNPETNYDSPGRRWFQFPESDNDVEYRKVLMYHKLKCFDQGTAGGAGYACGEWDYLTYSYLFDHTGELDSTMYNHPYYKINNQEFETDTLIFSPENGAPHDTYNTEYSRINLDIVGEVTTTINSETEQVSHLTTATNARRLAFTITAQELSTMGVVPGLPIKRISWNVESFQSDLLTLRVSQGEGEWQQVYAYPVEITDLLELDLDGDEIIWDSESDLHFDLSLDGVDGVSSDAVSSPSLVEAFDADGGYVRFDGLDKIIRLRSEKGGIGFGAQVQSKDDQSELSKVLLDIEPQDLIKFGLIPEFIGRLPVVATLEPLNEEALMTILTQPKNALTKQYAKLFKMEGVDLEFADEALKEVAKKALERKTGARGLRSILEQALLELMYDIPSMENLAKVIIDEGVIRDGTTPEMIFQDTPELAEKAS